jgi:hypothetical protein
MRKLLSLLSIFAIVLSCSSDEISTPSIPTPAPIVKYTIHYLQEKEELYLPQEVNMRQDRLFLLQQLHKVNMCLQAGLMAIQMPLEQ